MTEIWRQVKGWPNYEVSNLGRIWSYNRCRFLDMAVNSSGYKMVQLRHKGRSKMMSCHRLVAMTFLATDASRPHVNHKDCNKLNNRVENLEWCTSGENTRHATANGKHPKAWLGKRSPTAKLSDEEVMAFRKAYASGTSLYSLCSKYGVSSSTASRIALGRQYANLPVIPRTKWPARARNAPNMDGVVERR